MALPRSFHVPHCLLAEFLQNLGNIICPCFPRVPLIHFARAVGYSEHTVTNTFAKPLRILVQVTHRGCLEECRTMLSDLLIRNPPFGFYFLVIKANSVLTICP